MRKYFVLAVLAVCAGALFAQAPETKAPAGQQPARAAKGVKPAPAPPAARPQEEVEESGVMIDSRVDAEEARGSVYASAAEDSSAAAGIPSSFGQCRGVMTEGGRSLLVFESQDDGAISFVQVTLGKTGVSWKLAGRVPRTAD